MRKAGFAVVCISVLAILGYVAAGPFLAISSIKTGIIERDTELLHDNIDFVTLRQNLKDQLNAALVGEIGKKSDSAIENGAAALGMLLAGKVIEGAVDSYITPDGFAKIATGNTKPATDESSSTGGFSKEDLFKRARFRYDNLRRVSLIMPTADEQHQLRLVFSRAGLSWRMTNIVLPIGSNATPFNAPEHRTNNATFPDACREARRLIADRVAKVQHARVDVATCDKMRITLKDTGGWVATAPVTLDLNSGPKILAVVADVYEPDQSKPWQLCGLAWSSMEETNITVDHDLDRC